jgi:trehalose 6-phosphate phosphatase
VFDFDGTLAPIVSDPEIARMRTTTRRLLREVSSLYRCAVVSGRALGDLLPRVEKIPLWAVLGNHGSESEARPDGKGRTHRVVRTWRRELERRLTGLPGVWIEDKGYTLTIHYRDAPRPSRAARFVVLAGRALPGARLIDSHFGLNVLPATAPHKGTAVAGLRRRARCEVALYVGDDGSDELVFAGRADPSLLTVRIGRSRGSDASFYLRDQAEIDRLLETLSAQRDRGHGNRNSRALSGTS